MQEVDEGDGYSDDDLDALPPDAFHELQQNAIRSTQQLVPDGQLPLPSGFVQGLSEPDNLRRGLGNLAVTGNAFYKAPQLQPHQPSSDYGDFDDEMLDGEIFDAAEEPVILKERVGGFAARPPGESTQREQWQPQQFGAPRPQILGVGHHSLPSRSLPLPQAPQGLKGNNQPENGSIASAIYERSQRPRDQFADEPSNLKILEAQVQKVLSNWIFIMHQLLTSA
jgi:hypothetical protein